MVPESIWGLTSTIFPERPPVPWLDWQQAHFLFPGGWRGDSFKQVKRSGQELHQEGIWHLEYFILFENWQSVIGSTFCI